MTKPDCQCAVSVNRHIAHHDYANYHPAALFIMAVSRQVRCPEWEVPRAFIKHDVIGWYPVLCLITTASKQYILVNAVASDFYALENTLKQ
jgi:hypothetical protein